MGACLACLAAAQDAAAMEPRRVAAQMQEEVRPRAATARSRVPACAPARSTCAPCAAAAAGRLRRCAARCVLRPKPPPRAAPPCRAQLKAGEPRASAGVAASLAAAGRPLEARVFGLGVLTHLIKARWAAFGPEDRASLARLALDRLHEGAHASPARARACVPAARGAAAARRGAPRQCPKTLSGRADAARAAVTPLSARASRAVGAAEREPWAIKVKTAALLAEARQRSARSAHTPSSLVAHSR